LARKELNKIVAPVEIAHITPDPLFFSTYSRLTPLFSLTPYSSFHPARNLMREIRRLNKRQRTRLTNTITMARRRRAMAASCFYQKSDSSKQKLES